MICIEYTNKQMDGWKILTFIDRNHQQDCIVQFAEEDTPIVEGLRIRDTQVIANVTVETP